MQVSPVTMNYQNKAHQAKRQESFGAVKVVNSIPEVLAEFVQDMLQAGVKLNHVGNFGDEFCGVYLTDEELEVITERLNQAATPQPKTLSYYLGEYLKNVKMIVIDHAEAIFSILPERPIIPSTISDIGIF
ncbi:MAG: hypothetical protein PHC64_00725 [Candidatus Gastranaerophilales bacterium]|nr:hypothetical protein [Candidatus Gastranaerophilales bacterium]